MLIIVFIKIPELSIYPLKDTVQWFIDEGVSAFKHLPAYDWMISKLLDDGADGVIITRLDISFEFIGLKLRLDILEKNSQVYIVFEEDQQPQLSFEKE